MVGKMLFTDDIKDIFNDDAKLREKLRLYLGGMNDLSAEKLDEKTVIYLVAAKEFFATSGGIGLKMVYSWSWWAFFFPMPFLLYRKLYKEVLLLFFLFFLMIFLIFSFSLFFGLFLESLNSSVAETFAETFFLIVDVALMVFVSMNAKYWVIKRFVRTLMLNDDNKLIMKGGVNNWVAWVTITIWAIIIWAIIGIILIIAFIAVVVEALSEYM